MTLRIYILYVDMNNSEKAVTRCKKTYCPKFVSQLNKLTEKITKNMTRKLKGKEFAKLMKNITKKLKKNKTISKTMDKKILEDCVKAHCNPSCKDTIYQAGSQFPNMRFLLFFIISKIISPCFSFFNSASNDFGN